MTSLTEENYLKAIFVLNEEKEMKASTNAIAEKMETKASSVTDMMKRLKEKKLVHYKKYQAVKLTEAGEKVAISIIRKHRLWEYFLVEKLHFGWDEVHDIAEQLEHIQSTQLTNRLEKFLDFPTIDPHGDPIPNKDGKFPMKLSQTLGDAQLNNTYIVVGVKDHSTPFFNHLKQIKIDLGALINVLSISEFDHSMDVTIDGKHEAVISSEVAKNLYVKEQ
jgi:DtxR family Mn-dependent transcriptional regulator